MLVTSRCPQSCDTVAARRVSCGCVPTFEAIGVAHALVYIVLILERSCVTGVGQAHLFALSVGSRVCVLGGETGAVRECSRVGCWSDWVPVDGEALQSPFKFAR